MGRARGATRALLLVATFFLARLDLEPYAFLWLIAAWTVMCAGLSTRGGRAEELIAPAAAGRRDPP